MSDRENMRDKIKQAAMAVFVERGFDGARMQEIADRAGANKAMIYYYFDSKEVLFSAIFTDTFLSLFKMFGSIFEVEALDPEEVIPQLVHLHLDFLDKNSHLPKMIIREIQSGNPVVEKLIQANFNQFSGHLHLLKEKMAAAAAAGKIRDVDPLQTLWNLVALNIFIFVVRPILAAGFPEEVANGKKLLAEREKAIVDLVLYGLVPR
jgi:TetR/AcrR family transcriptional regulator